MRRAAALAAALALAAPGVALASAALRPLLLERGTYGESFTFVADLEDGTYVQAGLSFTNLGPGSTKGICRALVVAPDGRLWRVQERFSRSEITWRDGGDERLAVGPCAAWVSEDGSGVEVKLDGGSVRLATPERPRRQGGEAALQVDGRPYRSEVLLFRAPLAATLARPGAAARQVAGALYLDHTRSAVPTKDLARRWVRFRALRGPRALLVLGREGHDGRFAPVWACGEEGCQDEEAFAAARRGEGQATSFVVEVRGEAPLTLRAGRLLYRDAPVEDLGLLGPLVRPFTGSPVTYVYRATAQQGAGAPMDGILEVELSGE
ncbi:hypothetical protein [Anaeromyxobacter diazotrophicus]|uniref:Uncharacterized protein n=1 Tax=Anaeromyxobacter diazotrophicus TaxID=2590199 RepID=A0A7I9VRY9_9BACT|nr:hypothetical protein [Anaeromyxobacter diazotrophicus]GEJ59202.1 hypothetical protein AMYX_39430 [Anaeromyxobacter diazotrophicus]